MSSLFNWRPNVSLDDNTVIFTAFTTSLKGDFVDFPNYKHLPPSVKRNREFNIFVKKPMQAYFIASGSLDIMINWTPQDDADIQYYLDNYDRAPNIVPAIACHPPVVDWTNRTASLIVDSEMLPRNVWVEHNQHHSLATPMHIEAALDNTSLLCVRHNPAFDWNHKSAYLSSGSTLEYTKPTPATVTYVFCMTNPVTTSKGKVLEPVSGYNLESDTISFTADSGDAMICIVERA